MIPLHENNTAMERLMRWINSTSYQLATVAFLCLGNISRVVAQGLLYKWELLPQIHYWLEKGQQPAIKHAIVGLLRNMAIPPKSTMKICTARTLELIGPLINHPMQPIYAKVIVLLKIMTRPSMENLSETIIARVFRLLETATDDTTKNESFRFIGNLIRYASDTSHYAKLSLTNSMREVLLAHSVFQPYVKFAVTTTFPMLFNECLNALTEASYREDTFRVVQGLVLRPFAIPAREAPEAEGENSAPVPELRHLGNILVKLLEDEDPKVVEMARFTKSVINSLVSKPRVGDKKFQDTIEKCSKKIMAITNEVAFEYTYSQ
ncbi:hypothetical protein SYNPS1DRAFT_25220 [Syncephalis pseudoplumigaleata]|uniref:Armadillo-type protein n=1 Tax=Syncephalis pseudoplumigaleata TaxID=1712513 RepID=A0A4P9YT28_9FUNG|nr:hypothetical protein SYNPS1DRAFT_25220 [Syncephalis pseudoplumigaleata]|eukprot:RKP22858.1 hypothetical protein SYNPS1DRAFT_25220 [Syncephalis pseudoplumigaleata]